MSIRRGIKPIRFFAHSQFAITLFSHPGGKSTLTPVQRRIAKQHGTQ
ncbi:hypothetical protein GXM_03755 [Nostoc sphaeroides CCNUC1]|uniref:Uncharacterized protein n=1 Tax=Nostoc sphaeroides CCNUC1 TaxID=2653204 RepID=A0A5P8W0M8_9NOSO|nr:hypothetical protein GXM_03755 [Nostoc sphaeroides CCNUC1]